MKFFLWDIKETFLYMLYMIKKVFFNVIKSVMNFIVTILGIVRLLIYKVMRFILALTTIGFAIGFFLLFLNVKEAISGVSFTDTKYFVQMLYLYGAHIVMFMICKVLRPRQVSI